MQKKLCCTDDATETTLPIKDASEEILLLPVRSDSTEDCENTTSSKRKLNLIDDTTDVTHTQEQKKCKRVQRWKVLGLAEDPNKRLASITSKKKPNVTEGELVFSLYFANKNKFIGYFKSYDDLKTNDVEEGYVMSAIFVKVEIAGPYNYGFKDVSVGRKQYERMNKSALRKFVGDYANAVVAGIQKSVNPNHFAKELEIHKNLLSKLREWIQEGNGQL